MNDFLIKIFQILIFHLYKKTNLNIVCLFLFIEQVENFRFCFLIMINYLDEEEEVDVTSMLVARGDSYTEPISFV